MAARLSMFSGMLARGCSRRSGSPYAGPKSEKSVAYNLKNELPKKMWNQNMQHRPKYGIFGGKKTQTGNWVSEMKNHERRTFRPNVQMTTLHSAILERSFKLKCTVWAQRTIKKMGGLDGFLITGRHMDDSLVCQELRKKVLAVRAGGPVPELKEYYTRKIRDKSKRITWRGKKHADPPLLTPKPAKVMGAKRKDWFKEMEGYEVDYRDYSTTPYLDFSKVENALRVGREAAQKVTQKAAEKAAK